MKNSEIERLLDSGFKLIESTKAGYARVMGADGREYWITGQPPLNPAMSTDFYELSMLAAYVECGKSEETATFSAFYRKNPFGGGFILALGLEKIVEFLEQLEFTGRDIDHMRARWDMPDSFYEYIRELSFDGTVEAMPEGTMAQPYEPILQVTAPLPVANFIETYVLNQIGFASLVATKAARICMQAGDSPVMEFGLRRVQGGVEGGLIAARSAYIGGAASTSNVLAEQVYGIPAVGTIAHSYVMAFESQREAFRTYGDVFRENSVFLIDTYDYVSGMQDAVTAARDLGLKDFKGVRDDSGDLAAHSRKIREILDRNGYDKVKIAASSDLDEHKIRKLNELGADIDLYGVGTRLVTAFDSPSLGIVYKLMRTGGRDAIKISESEEKITDPGRKSLFRLKDRHGNYLADVIAAYGEKPEEIGRIESRSRKGAPRGTDDAEQAEPVLRRIFENGCRVYDLPDLDDIKQHASEELRKIPGRVRRLDDPEPYFVGLSPKLKEIKNNLLDAHS